VVKASGPGGREGGPPAIAGGNDGCIVLASRSPDPDPWGWCGPAGILVYTFKNGAFAPDMPGGYAPDIAMRQIPHVLDSSRWKDVTGWPAGMRGQFKGTQNGLWPSYHTAVCHDGRHAVAIWAAKRLERGDRPHDGMDLYGARVDAAGADAVNYDPLPVPVALGPGSQSGPRLAAGPTGASLLVCESRKGSEPAVVECRLLSDTPDTRAPAIERVSVDQPTAMRVFFDEPLDPASAQNAGAYKIEGVEIKLAALRRHRFAEPRVVTLTTSEQKVGDARRLKVNGVKDRAGNEVKDGACDYVFAPGQPLEPGVIPQWLVLGPFRADWKAKYVDPETARPKAGDPVEAESGGKKLQRAWTGAGTTGSGGVLRFSNVLGKQSGEMGGNLDKCVAFAHLYVWSPRAGPVNVCVDSNDGQRTWVNGKEAGFTDATRGLGEAIDVNKAEFVKGWNRLLIECDNKIGVWLMVVRITDDAGHEIEGLNWQLNDPGKE
jgi:hypothetical protein